ncbi:SRPBCC family protein [Streptacidiphilus fuscans]|uniref:SRPBCC family protein n=1 Tax=Streptacidiphilus fuscans TaxID=2789292 RepID=A0A931BAR8_9ACTN|nr:SRPBCC family protein [Streptacidiphilus fuscans]MBF9073151.1 SRPBCC family protein [Streptacidiphilus fuscans]
MTSGTGRDTRIIGSLRRVDDAKGAVTVEDVYDTDIDDLWSAVTEPDRLAHWIATIEGEPRLGGTVRTTFFASGYEGPGRIDICDAPRRLLVTFQPGTPDETVVEANLTPAGDGRTRLIVEERGFPLPEIAGHGGGWQLHAEDLAAYLGGHEPGKWPERWVELKPVYQALADDVS